MISVEIHQTGIPESARLSGRVIRALMDEIVRSVKYKPNGTLSVAFVKSKEIQRLNKSYRGKDAVTDVLAFVLQEKTGKDLLLGEVIICVTEAKKQAKEKDHTLKEELLDLLIHGTLHVLGYDHEKEKDARVMLPLQHKIFKAL